MKTLAHIPKILFKISYFDKKAGMRSAGDLFTNRAFYFKIIELLLVLVCKINGMQGRSNIDNAAHLSNSKVYHEHEHIAITSASGAFFVLIAFIVAYVVDETNHYILEMLFLFIYAFLLSLAGLFLIIEAEYLRTTIGGSISIVAAFVMLVDLLLIRAAHKNSRRSSD